MTSRLRRLVYLSALASLLLFASFSYSFASRGDAYAWNIIIDKDTHLETLIINTGDYVTIRPGVTVSADVLANHGTLTNYGKLGILGGENTGRIENYGVISYDPLRGDINNINGGFINMRQNSTFIFFKGGSYEPHNLVNGAGSTIVNNGTFVSLGQVGMALQNEDGGLLYRDCSGVFEVILSGAPLIDRCPVPVSKYSTLITATDLNGHPISGVWVVISSPIDRHRYKTGFTPLEFTALSNTTYSVRYSEYGGKEFVHWERNGIVEQPDDNPFSLGGFKIAADNTTLNAVYDTGKVGRGFSPFTFSAGANAPAVTVEARSADGNQVLHMWTVIQPLTIYNSDQVDYFIRVHDYGHLVFDHWEDGSTSSFRDVQPTEPMTITAYYKATT